LINLAIILSEVERIVRVCVMALFSKNLNSGETANFNAMLLFILYKIKRSENCELKLKELLRNIVFDR
jgi:hypothetical protein